MAIKINGTTLAIQPETVQWMDRSSYGIDGTGHPLYPRFRSCELKWGWMTAAQFNEIENFYLNNQSGTVVVTLPKYGATPYVYFDYTGCVLNEPSISNPDFENNIGGVSLLVANIVT